jgi:predicted deacylase
MSVNSLAEVAGIENTLQEFPGMARGRILGHVGCSEHRFPIYEITIGSENPQAPVLGVLGGVHGLERIGSQVAISLLNSLLRIQLWDETLQSLLKNVRIFFIPTVNPWGIYSRRRSNANGVDLMRNSPVRAEGQVPFGLGGQKFSPRLPWYQGDSLQDENRFVLEAIEKQIASSAFSWTLDIHSGFGWQDQLWFPFAKSPKPFPDLAQVYLFKNFFELSHPYHFYRIEPQSYRTHGDLWDHAYDLFRTSDRFYLPLTLELGSWNWVKKNPLQLFSKEGLFHPKAPHRHKRILRRHWTLFDFMIRMTASYSKWSVLSEEQKLKAEASGRETWYDSPKKKMDLVQGSGSVEGSLGRFS